MSCRAYAVVLALAASSAGAEPPVAGLAPDRRPADAPIVKQVDHGAAWREHALFGISRPYPASLRFLDDQGNWHTPFDRPGMTGRYDLRGWHASAPASKTGNAK